ncbi:deoxyhypusine synthase family protein, partial [Candidatus Woesearchaeota archaeon]|nr:deoxyhypusine synthase family protein [Candidatus Woesearchaeota archaeon]
MKPVAHIKLKKAMNVNGLVEQMNLIGVLGAGRLGKAVNICEAMITDKDCKVFLGLAGPLVPGGMR